jgi:Stigma-specific protein, Stig1
MNAFFPLFAVFRGRMSTSTTHRRHEAAGASHHRGDQPRKGKDTMTARRVLGAIAMALATLAMVVDAPSVEARGRRCRSDKQCRNGTCNDAGQCCSTFAGEVACGIGCCNTLLGGACCDGACRDTQSDGLNCGGCGNHCPATTICQNGVCGCPGGLTLCVATQECTNLEDDSHNCGTCGNECTGGSFCLDGSCVCPDGWSFCGETCVNTQSDRTNCGGCGTVCELGESCVAGQCKSSCSAGYILCGGQCVPAIGGEGICCQWDGNWHSCPTGSQCAGAYCCGAGTEVCLGDGSNPQCCYGGLVCQAGRCCFPDGTSGCPCESCTACCNRTN